MSQDNNWDKTYSQIIQNMSTDTPQQSTNSVDKPASNLQVTSQDQTNYTSRFVMDNAPAFTTDYIEKSMRRVELNDSDSKQKLTEINSSKK